MGQRVSQHETAGAALMAPLGPPDGQGVVPESSLKYLPSSAAGKRVLGRTFTTLGRPTFVTASEGHPEGSSRGLEESSERHQHRVWALPEPVLGLLAQLSH